MLAQCRIAILSLALFTVITGIIYPAFVTAIARVIFPQQANGSLVLQDGKAVGSALIGQPFDDPRYFWGRPSATAPFADNAGASTGSNLSPTNPDLVKAVQGRVEALRAADPGNAAPVPVDLVTASGSGLDPHIPTSAPPPRSIKRPEWPGSATWTRRPYNRQSTSTWRNACSVSWESPGSTCFS